MIHTLWAQVFGLLAAAIDQTLWVIGNKGCYIPALPYQVRERERYWGRGRERERDGMYAAESQLIFPQFPPSYFLCPCLLNCVGGEGKGPALRPSSPMHFKKRMQEKDLLREYFQKAL